jgi:segregation and condensation protein A
MADETPITDAVAGQPGSAEGFIVDEATDEVLRINLDQFQGPFEVLLYLIKAQEIDIFDIPIVLITEQYLRFLEIMRVEDLEVTGDFLVMAATLIHIKAKMLLPDEPDEEEEEFDEEDPRLELVEKLLEYRQFRDVTERLANLEAERQNWFTRNVKPAIEPGEEDEEEMLEVSVYDLIQAFRGVIRFMADEVVHTVEGEEASVDDKIVEIEEQLAADGSVSWVDLFRRSRGRVELVCYFLAILELCRMGRVRAHQHSSFEDIRLFPVTPSAAG